ncbi:MAG: type II toxin-antitoxin system RelE/ParE family toxin [Pirellulales bacterium]|nr:type II toxin-antitoxin system RelE/ParE family toxin [Pirellulales bacterium]
MNRRVVLSARAKRELIAATEWWATHRSTEQADRWYAGFLKTLEALSDTAPRYPLARERATFAAELRQLNYGVSKRPTHRAVFVVHDDVVVVLTIRHLAQRDLSGEELAEQE